MGVLDGHQSSQVWVLACFKHRASTLFDHLLQTLLASSELIAPIQDAMSLGLLVHARVHVLQAIGPRFILTRLPRSCAPSTVATSWAPFFTQLTQHRVPPSNSSHLCIMDRVRYVPLLHRGLAESCAAPISRCSHRRPCLPPWPRNWG
jgi:hypothetical protein